VIRSLAISQHKLGTREIVLVHHSRCGMEGLDEDGFAEQLDRQSGGAARGWSIAGFADVEQSVRESISRLRESPFLLHKDGIRGFVYEVESGRLREVRG
jgi:carbonic anhydrase